MRIKYSLYQLLIFYRLSTDQCYQWCQILAWLTEFINWKPISFIVFYSKIDVNFLNSLGLTWNKSGGHQFHLSIQLFNYHHNVGFLRTFVCNRNTKPKWFKIMVWDNGVHFRFYVAQVRYQIFLKIVKFMFAVISFNEITLVWVDVVVLIQLLYYHLTLHLCFKMKCLFTRRNARGVSGKDKATHKSFSFT